MTGRDPDLRRMDLNTLVALQALLAESSVTRAAERLLVGQPAMSATLSRLRRQFDDPLLVREGREFVLTPRAAILKEPLDAILGEIEALFGAGQPFDPATARRGFTVMMTECIAPVFLQPVLEELARDAPGIELQLLTARSDANEQLQQGQVDLLLHPRELLSNWRRFSCRVLFRDRHLAVIDSSNDLVEDELTLRHLLTLPYLAMSIDSRPSYADIQLDRLRIVPHRVVTVSGAMGPFLIRGTRLLTIAHESLARFASDENDSLRLCELPVQLADLTTAMFWSTRFEADPAHRWLRTTIADAIRSSPRHPTAPRALAA